MASTSWITIICTVISASVTVVSLFISNYIGQKTFQKKISLSNNQKRYKSLYLPLLQILYRYLPNGIDYGHFQSTRSSIASTSNNEKLKAIDPLVSTVMENMEYASPELLTKCMAYAEVANNNQLFNSFLSDKTDHLNQRNEIMNNLAHHSADTRHIYNEFILQILSESKLLAKLTGEVDLTAPVQSAISKIIPSR